MGCRRCRLPLVQVHAVLAHELAHVRNRDLLVSSIAAMIAAAISAIANILPRAGLATLFSRHPATADDVRRLRSYDSSPLVAQVA
jgi:predicted Zn-dependent protease